ncbi:hypothetical protein EUGRSUZ_L00699 [Eucalyptus grandis]|uniref:Uncharacterized protein n=1 Tax=Eucalyptus grandis TaxID=71139 RepID=A0A058ZX12_EUCGR|nr:hypothetical protein EUGRSUZ_L00699 [Eucalyptus grandis]
MSRLVNGLFPTKARPLVTRQMCSTLITLHLQIFEAPNAKIKEPSQVCQGTISNLPYLVSTLLLPSTSSTDYS